MVGSGILLMFALYVFGRYFYLVGYTAGVKYCNDKIRAMKNKGVKHEA